MRATCSFSALQRAENFSYCTTSGFSRKSLVSVLFSEPKISHPAAAARQRDCGSFSALQRAENFSQHNPRCASVAASVVSVLFSEPKISHSECAGTGRGAFWFQCSSASRKFLMRYARATGAICGGFSALQRAENFSSNRCTASSCTPPRFSALQRAENFSPQTGIAPIRTAGAFQCSSASRKFLITLTPCIRYQQDERFSALQRAENFSFENFLDGESMCERFSALQRAENFSRDRATRRRLARRAFQCSSASRKFLIGYWSSGSISISVSVLFSEPKISQPTLAPASIHIPDRDDHASSFLSLPGVSP